jgi:phage shock protein C
MIIMDPQKHLYRSRRDRVIGGVCSGIGDFFGLDHSIVRLIFVLGVLFGFGSFLFIYLVMWIVVPDEPTGITPVPTAPQTPIEPPAPPAE